MNKKEIVSFTIILSLVLTCVFGVMALADTISYDYDINTLLKDSSHADSDEIELTQDKVILSNGYTFTLALKNASNQISWNSSNKKVVAIKRKKNNAILIQGKRAGKAVITGTYNNEKYRCKVNVVDEKRDVITGKKVIISAGLRTGSSGNSMYITAAYPCSITIEPYDPSLISLTNGPSKWNGKSGSVIVHALPNMIANMKAGIDYWDYFSFSQILIKTVTTSVIVRNSLNPQEVDAIPVEVRLYNWLL